MMRFLFVLVSLCLYMEYGSAINSWRSCADCIAGGLGWCPIRRKCGGFANKMCSGTETDNSIAPVFFGNTTEMERLFKPRTRNIVILFNEADLTEEFKFVIEELAYDLEGSLHVYALDTLYSEESSYFDIDVPTLPALLSVGKSDATGDISATRIHVTDMSSKQKILEGIGAALSGVIIELSEIVVNFMSVVFKGGVGDADDIIDEAISVVDGLGEDQTAMGEFYINIMEDSTTKGISHLSQLQNKLQRAIKFIQYGPDESLLADGLDINIKERLRVIKVFTSHLFDTEEEQKNIKAHTEL